ncbi:MAG: LuxR C-terminal-related transcriptional regulator [Chloroflexota bacterium]
MPTVGLPTATTSFVGRAEELAQIAVLLADPACRLLTLVGPGGIGKSRLALEVACQLTTPEQSYFIPLQPLTSTDFIVSTIANAVSFQFDSGGDSQQQLFNYLHDKRWLLVLDNFEHLLSGSNLVSEMLAAAPGIRLLVTSRERLNLVEEWVLDIFGLTYPTSETDALSEPYSAVELFIQHAARVKASFKLTKAQNAAVIRICRLVEGMPLGIELAASWVRALSCAAIADEIECSLDILETSARNVEPRHRTMRAAFAPTWNRLSDHEQAVFMKLSVFRGGFMREAAEQVTDASVRVLAALVDKSLLRVDADGRYDIHELLRQYAEERLRDLSHTHEQTQDRHCTYYADFIGQWGDDLTGMMHREPTAEINREIENMRVAFRQAVAGRKLNALENFLRTLLSFYDLQEQTQEGEEAFRLAAQAVRAGFNETDEQQRRLLGLSLSGQAWFLCYSSRYAEALVITEESLALLLPLGSTRELVQVYASFFQIGSDYLGMVQFADQALKHAQAANYPNGILRALLNLSWYAFRAGDYEESERRAQEALALSHKHDFAFWEVWALQRLSDNALIRGDFAEAKRCAHDGLARAQAIKLRPGILFHYLSLGETAYAQRAYAEAQHYFQECTLLAYESGSPKKIVWTGGSAARTAARLGEIGEAQKQFLEILRIAQEAEDEGLMLSAAGNIAVLMASVGKRERAIEILVLVIGAVDNVGGYGQGHEALRAELQTALAPEVYAAAWERGTKLEIKALVAELAAELSQPREAWKASERRNPQAVLQTARPDALTTREREILSLMADGFSNGEIAARLVLTTGTVKWYVNRIFSKLDATSRTQAVARARAQGLLFKE